MMSGTFSLAITGRRLMPRQLAYVKVSVVLLVLVNLIDIDDAYREYT